MGYNGCCFRCLSCRYLRNDNTFTIRRKLMPSLLLKFERQIAVAFASSAILTLITGIVVIVLRALPSTRNLWSPIALLLVLATIMIALSVLYISSELAAREQERARSRQEAFSRFEIPS